MTQTQPTLRDSRAAKMKLAIASRQRIGQVIQKGPHINDAKTGCALN
jgi:hypothetical protein